ncbi:hypothetical protein [Aquibacillus rhizosphaerae]|uniref:Dehydrogenase n=1 Tax=Aquibacillus rhizosphaerae TaxID=3051431 RepID=A0ABT7L2L5_9BACI|nr:hypothetical protein [Aquibacillus sp. LR5S19]MDL4839420.1 hypothetical protein [Aquibacillus sp. LR5S19]
MKGIIPFLNLFIIGLFICVLILGLIQSKIHSFKAGFYAFLLLLFNQVYLYIALFIINPIIINHVVNSSDPTGMTGGEVVSLLALIPKTIELIAITILVVGLYKMWVVKKQTSS